MSRGDLSAGVLLYRTASGELQILIAHPGGPFWRSKHEGAWSIPKGLVETNETAEAAARREFAEETGTTIQVPLLDLGTVRLRSGKTVHGFAAPGDLDPASLNSSTFPLEWPPRSGTTIDVPEIDQVAWCDPSEAKRLLNPAQGAFVDRLVAHLDG